MDAASIEEINKIRMSMGMKPLPVPGAENSNQDSTSEEDEGSTLEKREAHGYDNFRRLREEQDAKKKRELRVAEIKKAREKAQRDAAVKGKGLAEEEDGDLEVDTKAWLKNQKKRQAKIERIAKEREAKAAAEAAKAAAKEHALANVKVGHDVSDFLDDDEQILTLKDTGVLDEDEEDELEALALREQEKLEERLRLKKKKPLYDPLDDTEHGILAQYDEEIEGKKKKSFALDALAASNDIADILAAPPAQKRKRAAVDMDQLEDAPAPSSDYLDIPVKKTKKKKTKATRRRAADDDDGLLPDTGLTQGTNQEMDVDSGASLFKKKVKVVDESYVDDDDLQASLNLQRKTALKKRKAADILKEADELAKADTEQVQHGGLVIDEITGFVDLLGDTERNAQPKRVKSEKPVSKMEEEPSEDEDKEMRDAPAEVKEESTEEGPEGITTTGVEEEKTVSQGMGATLELLRKRHLIDPQQSASELNEKYRKQEFFKAELKRQMAIFDEEAKRAREADRASGRLDRMSARDREAWQQRQNTAREQHQARITAKLYDEGYTPNIELKYVDEHGRRLDKKEAWRHLSHAFHGKGSGKGKTDKMLKKIEAEKRREAENILDVSQNVGMSSAASHQLKKRKEAGVRLA
jgi:U4/U6.U5 tri-snRNP-associated protein 1